MFYEPYKPRRRNPSAAGGRRRARRAGFGHSRRGCLTRLIKLGLLALAVYLCILVCTTGSVGALLNSLMPGGAPLGHTNILLLGVDETSQAHSRSDTMIVASVSNSGQVKLSSIMRDTLVAVEGHGARKINSAYAYGGGEMALATVNKNFGLDIAYYAVVDFSGFADIIDGLGGVRLTVSKAEQQAMNQKNGHRLDSYGENVLLDGVQALRYVRIRKIDSDYQRCNRQRRLLTAVLNSLRTVKDPIKLFNTAKNALKYVKTNMNFVALAATAIKALGSTSSIEQKRFPAEGTYESGTLDGVWSIRADLNENARLMKEFIYSR